MRLPPTIDLLVSVNLPVKSRTVVRMRKTLIALVTTAVVAGGGIAAAQLTAEAAPKCKTLGSEQTVEQRVTMGGDVQKRTVTVTKQRCKGKISTSVSYGAWR
jgi:hypothetical protein